MQKIAPLLTAEMVSLRDNGFTDQEGADILRRSIRIK
jgi:hypothetical protein